MPQALKVAALIRLNGDGPNYTLTIANPTAAIDPFTPGTVLPGATGTDCVLSCPPDGVWQARPHGTAGAWETCTKASGLLTYRPEGVFVLPVEQ